MVEGDDLEGLSRQLGNAWEALALRLGFNRAEIQGLEHNIRTHPEIQLRMLEEWKQRLGRDATYQALNDALCHVYVNRESLAETFCIDNNYAAETSTSFNSSARVGIYFSCFHFFFYVTSLYFILEESVIKCFSAIFCPSEIIKQYAKPTLILRTYARKNYATVEINPYGGFPCRWWLITLDITSRDEDLSSMSRKFLFFSKIEI